ncbi:2-isopropylmalate synthase [Pseudobacteriovorax antillogorgiicola]|uniref:2-isopropylmalate synthase n=1 Tax=Pseudobacteriovorax antillogorgiicola TaxID=1513793 RepID=A0A1Y6C8F5_9BACT|nr:2-isopropylmalate synthase [Pseudobacteriovorax antillogorgiicola]TCS51679.1 2-isopropylmalate synthase [Pseudobacteriovorax antillogorgiicola]SMF49029.1 2-isopropylmalate synthase [Pseudobacteriovorax antillogorgiicola]
MEQIVIFDTTLRDGEQSLKASLNTEAKLHIARALERLGVDYIEAGFPVSSPGDFQAVSAIASAVKGAGVCALARALDKDIDVAGEAIQRAERGRIHTFIATSPIHVEKKLRKDFQSVVDMACASIKRAARYTDDIEFSCEDAGRTPREHLFTIIEAAINAGATTINIPDTVGYTIPSEFGGIIADIRNQVPNIDRAVLSVHCHDDLGMSVANSIAAVEQGARQIEGTINGLGERAGNCALEEIVAILKTRQDQLPFRTNVKTEEIYYASKIIRQRCNVMVQPNKAIVGDNAFSHSSGIHQDGVLKSKNTYEILAPESIGIPSSHLHLTSRSGRHVIRHRLSELGYQDGQDYHLDDIYERFLVLADKKGSIYDYDLEALIFLPDHRGVGYELEQLNVISGSGSKPSATVCLQLNGKEYISAATGNGPVEAVFHAIDSISGIKMKLEDYHIHSQGAGRDALGQVNIVTSFDGRRFHGLSYSTDIVEGSAQAYLDALNTCMKAQHVSHVSRKAATGDTARSAEPSA